MSSSHPSPDPPPNGRLRKILKAQVLDISEEMDLNPITPGVAAARRLKHAQLGLKAAAIILGSFVSIHLWNALSDRYLFNNPKLTLQEIAIESDGWLRESRILAEARLKKGMNLPSLDLDHIKTQLESLPQVQNVEITREIPSKLNILISERKPIAWLEATEILNLKPYRLNESYLIDAEGVPFLCEALPSSLMSLPVISLPDLQGFQAGKTIKHPAMKAAVGLMNLFREDPVILPFTLKRIDSISKYGLKFTSTDLKEVTFGWDDWKDQWQRWKQIQQRASEEQWEQIASINLIPKVNVPVRFKGELPTTPEENSPQENSQQKTELASQKNSTPRKNAKTTQVKSPPAKPESPVETPAAAPVTPQKNVQSAPPSPPSTSNPSDPRNRDLNAILGL